MCAPSIILVERAHTQVRPYLGSNEKEQRELNQALTR